MLSQEDHFKTEPRVEIFGGKKLAGLRLMMSLDDNKTGLLWKNFMLRRNELTGVNSTHRFSIQVYPHDYFNSFNTSEAFEKWAAVEVMTTHHLPEGMEFFELPAGLYVVFKYKGLSTDTRIFQYIFTEWLPDSAYDLDERPHFEILGEKYRNDDPDSEEEIWIPVKAKQ